MYIPQHQLDKIDQVKGKVVVIYGPRRVGKTTLMQKYLSNKQNYLLVTGEDIFVQKALSSKSIEKLKSYLGSIELLVVDEAQYIPDIGLNLKLIVDHIPSIKVIATGSSTFDLLQNVGEPLTGRKVTIRMFPISQIELSQLEKPSETQGLLENRMIYGSYPEVLTASEIKFKQSYLRELVSSYLFKDVLAYEGLKNSRKMVDLLTLLAFQVGKEVSSNEIATQLGVSRATVERYLDLLQNVFILYNVRGFSRNLRKEVTKTSRYYFYDNGIRNAIINNFNPLSERSDIGALWENYIVIERLKKQEYLEIASNNYFWRTYDKQEIDWVEEREGKLFGYEVKWKNKTVKPPKNWVDAYPKASFETITNENYLDFII